MSFPVGLRGGETVNRTRRCRQESRAAGLDRVRGAHNRALRLGRGAAFRGGALGLLAVAVAGCSLSFPLASMKPDATPTGSIDRTVAYLSPTLDREDVRRAKAALAVALDPQGNGARAAWQNPQSGAHGAFAAAAPPFADHDRVCRAFAGEVTPIGGGERRLTGSACREGDGSWEMREDVDSRKT